MLNLEEFIQQALDPRELKRGRKLLRFVKSGRAELEKIAEEQSFLLDGG